MELPRTPEYLKPLFDEALPQDPRVERRKMFGYPSAFVGGNMFAGLHGEYVVVRLPDSQRAEFLSLAGARAFEPMPGRPMREYVTAPPAVVDDPTALRDWLAKAFHYALALPPKTNQKTSARTNTRRRA